MQLMQWFLSALLQKLSSAAKIWHIFPLQETRTQTLFAWGSQILGKVLLRGSMLGSMFLSFLLVNGFLTSVCACYMGFIWATIMPSLYFGLSNCTPCIHQCALGIWWDQELENQSWPRISDFLPTMRSPLASLRGHANLLGLCTCTCNGLTLFLKPLKDCNNLIHVCFL